MSRRTFRRLRKKSVRSSRKSNDRRQRRSLLLESLESRRVLATVSGAVFHDLSGDGQLDAGEDGRPGHSVFVDLNNNGLLDRQVSGTVEPDDYEDGDILNTIHPGLLLTAADASNVSRFDVTSESVNQAVDNASTGQKVFAHAGVGFWDDTRRLRMDFDSPVSFVAIDFLSSSDAGEVGRLDALDANGNVVATFDTQSLMKNQIERMVVSDTLGRIKTAVAYSPAGQGSFGRLDNLEFSGTVVEPFDITDEMGAYSFDLPDGDHVIRQVVERGTTVTGPLDGTSLSNQLISVENPVDHVYDPVQRITYISTGDGTVERFDVGTGQLLEPFDVGVNLSGLDVTPDGRYLYVAENETGQTESFVRKVDTTSGEVTILSFERDGLEAGVFDIAVARNGKALFTTDFAGSGQSPLREIVVNTDVISTRNAALFDPTGKIQQSTRISRSADRNVFFLTESNISSGPAFIYNATTDQFSSSKLLTGSFLGGANTAVSRDGSFIALESFGTGLVIYDQAFNVVKGDLPDSRGGLAFSPTEDKLFVGDTTVDQIIVYDTANGFTELSRIPVGEDLPNPIGTDGHRTMTVSSDGQRLFINGRNGVRMITLQNPGAHSITVDGNAIAGLNFGIAVVEHPVLAFGDRFTVSGTATTGLDVLANDIGNELSLVAGSVVAANGTAAISGNAVTYNSGGFSGQTSFTYTVRDGEGNTDTATVHLDVGTAGPGGQLRGRIFDDLDGDGVFEPGTGETGRTDQTLFLDANGNGVLDANASTVEPDDYSSNQFANVLNLVNPRVRLSTADTDNTPMFSVTSNVDAIRSTGDQVFGHSNVSFWNNSRRLRMDFAEPVSSVSIDFIGSSNFGPERGRLDIYNSSNTLIGTYNSEGRLRNEVETMLLEREAADIAWAVAFVPIGSGSFGRLDNLRFSSREVAPTFAADGSYVIDNVPAGTHVLSRLPADGFAQVSPARADGTIQQLGIVDRRGQVFDPVRRIHYIATASGNIERFDSLTRSLLPAFSLATELKGIDVTPDGNTLLVAEVPIGGGQGTIRRLDLDTDGSILTSTAIPYSLMGNEVGAFDVVAVSNNLALFTTSFSGSGFVPLRQIDLTNNSVSVRNDVDPGPVDTIRQNTMIARSADYSQVIFAEANISSGPFFSYNPATNAFSMRETTATFLSDANVAVNRDGSRFAMEAFGTGLSVLNAAFETLEILPHYRGGVAFDPTRDILYAGDTDADQIVAIDSNTFDELYRFNAAAGNTGGNHEMHVSADGRQLFLSTASGINVYSLTQPDSYALVVREGQRIENLDFAVRLTGENRPPSGLDIEYTVDEDMALVVPAATGLLNGAADPDNGDASSTNDNVLGVRVTTPPTNGLLTMLDTATGEFEYTPTANFSGTDTFTYRVVDDGGLESDDLTVTIEVQPLNDAPTLSTDVPVIGSTDDEITITRRVDSFLVGADDVDPDAVPAGIAVTGLTGAGTWFAIIGQQAPINLSIANLSDATAVLIGPTDSIRYQPVAGTLETATITYRAWDMTDGNAGSFPDVSINGGQTAYSLNTDTASLNVVNNTPPVLTLPSAAVTYTENLSAQSIDSSATVTDSDNAFFLGGRVHAEITAGIGPNDKLLIRPILGITLINDEVRHNSRLIGRFTGGLDGEPLEIQLTSALATVSAVESLVRAISFENASDMPQGGRRTVRITIGDGTSGEVFRDQFVDMTPVNDAPMIAVNVLMPVYVENAPPVPIAEEATIVDADSPNLAGGSVSVTITSGASADDSLTVINRNGVTFEDGTGRVFYDDGSGAAELGQIVGGSGQAGTPLVINLENGNVRLEEVQALLRAIGFAVDSETPTTNLRVLEIAVTDGPTGATGTATKTVVVGAVNDLPVVQLNGATLEYTENSPPQQIDSTAVLSDADNPNFNGGRLTVHVSENGTTNDRLSVIDTAKVAVNGAQVSVTLGPGSPVVPVGQLSGGIGLTPLVVQFNTAGATVDHVEAVLQAIAYSNASNDPSTETRTVTFSVRDPGAGIGQGTQLVDIIPVNDPPVITVSAQPTAFTEGDLATAIDDGILITDVDSPDFSGGTLTVTLDDGTENDSILVAEQNGVTVNGANIEFDDGSGPMVIGTFAVTDNDHTLTVTFTTAAATRAAVQELARAVTFANTSADPSSEPRTFTFTLVDGDGEDDTGTATQTLTLVPVTDPPALTILSGPVTYVENADPLRFAPQATLTDPDSSNFNGGFLRVSFVVNDEPEDLLRILPGDITVQDDLVFYDNGVAQNQIGMLTGGTNGDDLLIDFTTAHATPTAAQQLIRSLAFENPSDRISNLPRTVRITVFDGDGSGGTVTVDQIINVTPVNDTPLITATGDVTEIIEGGEPVPVGPDIEISDVDSDNFATGGLRVEFESGGTTNDQLRMAALGGVSLSADQIFFAGSQIATFAGGTNGTPLTITFLLTATQDGVQATARAVTYENIANDPSTTVRQVKFTVNDGDGGAASASVVKDVAVVPVNQAPVIRYVSALTTWREGDAPRTLDPALEINDVDSDDFSSGSLRVQVSGGTDSDDVVLMPNSEITIDGNQVSFNGDVIGLFDDVGSAIEVQFTTPAATGAAAQALARALKFGNQSQNPAVGQREILITLDDGDGDVNGGNAVGNATRNFNVVVVNTRPEIVARDDTVEFREGGAAILLDPTLVLRDVDSPDLLGGSLTISVIDGGSTDDTLTMVTRGGIFVTADRTRVLFNGQQIGQLAGGDGGQPLQLIFTTASATPAAAQAAARAVGYSNSSNNPSVEPRTIEFRVTDGDGDGVLDRANDVVALQVNPVNEPPVIRANEGSTRYREDDAPVVIAPNLSITDADSSNFNGGSLRVAIDNATDQNLTLGQTANVTINGNLVSFGGNEIGTFAGGAAGEPLVINFTSDDATSAAAQAVGRVVSFAWDDDNPPRLPLVARFTLDDGDGGQSAQSATRDIEVSGMNDQPVITLPSGPASYVEQAGPVKIDSGAEVVDPDSVNFLDGLLTVSIEVNGSQFDQLTIQPNQDVSIEGNVVRVNGATVGRFGGGVGGFPLGVQFTTPAATPAAVETVLRSIVFSNTSPNPAVTVRTVRFTLADGDGAANQADQRVSVTRVNDAPHVDLNGADEGDESHGQWLQGLGHVDVVEPDARVTDPDNTTLESATARIANIRNPGAEVLRVDTTGTDINATYNAATGVLTLAGVRREPIAAFAAVLRTLTYDNLAADPNGTPRIIQVSVDDGQLVSNVAEATVTLDLNRDEDGVRNFVEDGAPNGGDGNRDGVRDSDQQHVTSLPDLHGHYVTLAAPSTTTLNNVRIVGENPSPGTVPQELLFPMGLLEFRVDNVPVGGAVDVTLFLGTGHGINTWYKFGRTADNSTPHWYPFLYNGVTGAEILRDRVIMHFVDGGLGDDDLTANGSIVDPSAPAVFENPVPWRNPNNAFDVNNNGVVTPLDALLIIDDLGNNGGRFLTVPPVPPLTPPPFLDVSGDNRVTALDASLVIENLNNRINSSSVSAEAEPLLAAATQPLIVSAPSVNAPLNIRPVSHVQPRFERSLTSATDSAHRPAASTQRSLPIKADDLWAEWSRESRTDRADVESIADAFADITSDIMADEWLPDEFFGE